MNRRFWGLAVGAVLVAAATGCKPQLDVTPDSLHYELDENTMTIAISNASMKGEPLVFSLSVEEAWVELSETSGTSTGPDDVTEIDVTIDRSIKGTDEDPAFNTAVITIESNGGDAEVIVTTNPNYHTEVFEDGEFDLQNTAVIFTPDETTASHYRGSKAEGLTDFPTDPTLANPVTFDTDPQPAAILDETFTFYGVEYDSFSIGSDGFVAFGEAPAKGTDATSLDAHFAQPRISVLSRDLDVLAGDVSYLQTEDRLAVTWENVPDTAKGDTSNSFQLEMFFDGRIQLSYLDVQTSAAIVGLSFGPGDTPADFVPTDLAGFTTGELKTYP